MRRAIITATIIGIVLTAAACGRGNREPTPEPAPAAQQQSEAAPTEAAAPDAEEADAETSDTETDASDAETAEEDATETEDAEQPESPISAMDSPISAMDSPVSAMDSPMYAPPPPVEPTVTDETGGVMGTLLVVRPSGEILPVTSQYVALGEIILDDEGKERFAGYSAASAPRKLTNDFGQFAISEVPPGRYVLVLDVVVSAFLLNDGETGQGRVVEVLPGEIVDLGTLEYESLPIYGYSEDE